MVGGCRRERDIVTSTRLSILVTTLRRRRKLLERLTQRLTPQLRDDVELVIALDNGELPVGEKRNALLDKARGEYVAFVDDDDLVADDYVARVLEAVAAGPDCVGLEGEITLDGGPPQRFVHSIVYDRWFEANGTYYRCPNHVNPVKREIAVEVRFPLTDVGEDHEYSQGLRTRLRTEVFVPWPLYFYEAVTGAARGRELRWRRRRRWLRSLWKEFARWRTGAEARAAAVGDRTKGLDISVIGGCNRG